MTSTRAAKLLQIYSRALSADTISAYSHLWGAEVNELVLNAPLEGSTGVIEEVSGVSVPLPGAAFLTAPYSLGICVSGERYMEASPMCLSCEAANCLLCEPILSVCVWCDIGYFLPPGGLCSACDSTCHTCSNSTPADCLSCLSPRILVANKCLLNGVFATSTELASFESFCLTALCLFPPFQRPAVSSWVLTAVPRLNYCPIASLYCLHCNAGLAHLKTFPCATQWKACVGTQTTH